MKLGGGEVDETLAKILAEANLDDVAGHCKICEAFKDVQLALDHCLFKAPYTGIRMADFLRSTNKQAVAPSTENDEESDKDLGTSSGEEDEMVHNACSEEQGEQIMSLPDNTVTVVVDRWLKFVSTALMLLMFTAYGNASPQQCYLKLRPGSFGNQLACVNESS